MQDSWTRDASSSNFFPRDKYAKLARPDFLTLFLLCCRGKLPMYNIYKVLPEDTGNLQIIMNSAVVLKVRFPEVIGISVKTSRPRALVFDFLVMNFFIHTILLRTNSAKECFLIINTMLQSVVGIDAERVVDSVVAAFDTYYMLFIYYDKEDHTMLHHMSERLDEHRQCVSGSRR